MANELTKLRLLKPHRHNGQLLQAGADLYLSKPTADWLIRQGVAHSVGTAAPGTVPKLAAPVRKSGCCGGKW